MNISQDFEEFFCRPDPHVFTSLSLVEAQPMRTTLPQSPSHLVGYKTSLQVSLETIPMFSSSHDLHLFLVRAPDEPVSFCFPKQVTSCSAAHPVTLSSRHLQLYHHFWLQHPCTLVTGLVTGACKLLQSSLVTGNFAPSAHQASS